MTDLPTTMLEGRRPDVVRHIRATVAATPRLGPPDEVLNAPDPREDPDFEEDQRSFEDQAEAYGAAPATLPSPADPMAVARGLVDKRYKDSEDLTLRHWRGGWWCWARSHWNELEERAVRRDAYRFTEHANYRADGKLKPWEPTRFKIGNLLEALAAVTHLDATIDQPGWIDGSHAGRVVAVANGLFDLERRRLLPHSPRFFNQTAVPFAYDPGAPPPARWLEFLAELWPEDRASVDALAEWFGYVISGRVDLHKMLLIVGPTRGGKGTMARVLGKMIGPANVAGPTLSSLSFDFGLAPLVGKPLAVISDARLDAHRDSSVVVERLLAISGEDTITVNRKYREQWTGKLPTRFLLISNELPRLGDASATIANRFVVLLLRESWLGREDHGLEDALTAELPGILNWSLAGLDRLTVQDRFTRPVSTDEAILALQDLASPVAAFVREQCMSGPRFEVPVDVMFTAWKSWADDNGSRPGNRQTFGRNLRAVIPNLRTIRPRDGDERNRVYVGVSLRDSTGHSAADRGPSRTNGHDSDSGPQWSAVHPNVGGTSVTASVVDENEAERANDDTAELCPECGHAMVEVPGAHPVCTNAPGHPRKASAYQWPGGVTAVKFW